MVKFLDSHMYLLSRILHDYPDSIGIQILKNIVPAMAPDSRLIIVNMLIPDRAQVEGEKECYCQDFALLVSGGRQKKPQDFHDMFDAVGLELVKAYPADIGMSVMLETLLKGHD